MDYKVVVPFVGHSYLYCGGGGSGFSLDSSLNEETSLSSCCSWSREKWVSVWSEAFSLRDWDGGSFKCTAHRQIVSSCLLITSWTLLNQTIVFIERIISVLQHVLRSTEISWYFKQERFDVGNKLLITFWGKLGEPRAKVSSSIRFCGNGEVQTLPRFPQWVTHRSRPRKFCELHYCLLPSHLPVTGGWG